MDQYSLSGKIKELSDKNLDAESVWDFIKYYQISENYFISEYLSVVKSNSLPLVSNYSVSAAVITKKGRIFPGANIEFPRNPPHLTLHAEQSAIVNALGKGENKLKEIWVSDKPCGMCLQFLAEVTRNEDFTIRLGNGSSYTLKDLLTYHFVFEKKRKKTKPKITVEIKNELVSKAVKAARKSVLNVTDFFAGSALETEDGKIYKGFYVENGSFNTSILPVQMALSALLADRKKPEQIKRAVFVQTEHSAMDLNKISKMILSSVSNAEMNFETLIRVNDG